MSAITVRMEYRREETPASEIAVLVVQAVVREMGWAESENAEATFHKEIFDSNLWRRAYNVYAVSEGVCAFVVLERKPEVSWEAGKLVWLHTKDRVISADFTILEREVSIFLPYHYSRTQNTANLKKN